MNDTKHTGESSTEWFSERKIHILEWPGPDINPIEMMRAVVARNPINIHEMKQFCKEG